MFQTPRFGLEFWILLFRFLNCFGLRYSNLANKLCAIKITGLGISELHKKDEERSIA
jgi:hypothetical protein